MQMCINEMREVANAKQREGRVGMGGGGVGVCVGGSVSGFVCAI